MNPMDWIKRNYDQFILALVSVGLLVLSGFLISSAIAFQGVFAGIRGEVIHHNEIPPVDMSGLQDAVNAVQTPGTWEVSDTEGSLFVSVPYIVVNGLPVDTRNSLTPLHPPVPNKWINAHKLDILDNNILNEDPDGDGFTNLEEWRNLKGDGTDSSDPQDAKSHPPYYTKLRLVQFIKQPFRLQMEAYDGDVKKPETMSFQIKTLDVNQPSQFRKIGEMIEGTKFKVIKFMYKSVPDPGTGGERDVSELTVENTENGDNVILVLEETANSPDSYALFRYLWNNSGIEVKKGREFVLLPDADLRYKLIDIKETQALIQTPSGQQVRVPHLDEPWTADMYSPDRYNAGP